MAGVPCVVLATSPKPGAQIIEPYLHQWNERKGDEVLHGYFVFFKNPGDTDGGNGGGGETGRKGMKPALGRHLRGAWDFQWSEDQHEQDWIRRYPKLLKFEVCLWFKDISVALWYLRNDDLGILLMDYFKYVQVIPISQPVTPVDDIPPGQERKVRKEPKRTALEKKMKSATIRKK